MSMAKLATVSCQDGVVELRNQHWLLRVGIDGWLNPGYLLDVDRNVPLADEMYAYALALTPLGKSGFTGGKELTSGPAGDLVSANRVRFRDWATADLPGGGKEVHFMAVLISACLGQPTSRSSTFSASPTLGPGSRSRSATSPFRPGCPRCS